MDVAVGKRWEPMLDALVEDGSFTGPEDVVAEGLRLVEARQQKQAALKATIEASLARGGSVTSEQLAERLDARFAMLRAARA